RHRNSARIHNRVRRAGEDDALAIQPELSKNFLPECLSHCKFFLGDCRLRRVDNRNRLFLDIRADPIPLAVLRRSEYGTVALRTTGASHETDGAVNALE